MVVYDPIWYLTMYFGAWIPMEPSLLGTEDYYWASELGSEVGSSVGFLLESPGSGVGSVEVSSLRDSQESSTFSSESSG